MSRGRYLSSRNAGAGIRSYLEPGGRNWRQILFGVGVALGIGIDGPAAAEAAAIGSAVAGIVDPGHGPAAPRPATEEESAAIGSVVAASLCDASGGHGTEVPWLHPEHGRALVNREER